MMASIFRRFSSQGVKAELEQRMKDLTQRISSLATAQGLAQDSHKWPEPRLTTLDERLKSLDAKVQKLEALREAARPEEERIKNLDDKYGRAGRYPAYQWYGAYLEPQDRIPHTADRLGSYRNQYPQRHYLLDMLGVQSDQHNPSFHSFFVQLPQTEPDPDVNFEKGEVVYENTDFESGVRLFGQLSGLGLGFITTYVVQVLASGRAVYPIGEEFADIRQEARIGSGWLDNYASSGGFWQDLDTFSYIAFVSPLVPLAVMGYVGLCKYAAEPFITKLQYNKEKDLMFVTKLQGAFFKREVEEVCEVVNMQVLPPSMRNNVDLTGDELMTIHDMTNSNPYVLSKNEKYWHPELGTPFKNNLYKLWS